MHPSDFQPVSASEPPPGQNWNPSYIGSERWKENERLKKENLERIQKRIEELDRLKARVFAQRRAEADAKAKPMPAGPKPMPAVPKPAGPMPAGPKPADLQVKAMPKVPKGPGGPKAVPKAKAVAKNM